MQLQRKDITLAEALTAVETAKSNYQRIWSDDTFKTTFLKFLDTENVLQDTQVEPTSTGILIQRNTTCISFVKHVSYYMEN